ncbi:MAG TPA: YetF domain-containing protein [Thermoanaerobaculia bacterium]|nr:YetF domain-containing protein [Thermoanaerobaculia bacterium]
MESVLRGAVVYLFLLIIFRITGKRSLDQVTTFDFVLLLIISETTQQALLGEDFSVTNGCLLILTLFVLDQGLTWLKSKSRAVQKLTEGLPVILLENGRPFKDRMRQSQVDEDDILEAARELQGLERLEQIKYAVLERHGGITIVPKPDAR